MTLHVTKFRSARFSAEPVLQNETLDADAGLMFPEAAGLSTSAQDKLIQLVPGINRFRGRKQLTWKRFDGCYDALKNSPSLQSINSVSEGVWTELDALHKRISLRQTEPVKPTREILSLKSRLIGK
jgi:hypothetical protein